MGADEKDGGDGDDAWTRWTQTPPPVSRPSTSTWGRMILGIVAVLFIAGTLLFYRQRDLMRLPPDAERARVIVLQSIPVGTEVADGQQIMERSRFACVLEEDVYVDEESPWYPWTRRLYCWKSRWAGLGGEWRVSLWLNGEDVVQRVHVAYIITAP